MKIFTLVKHEDKDTVTLDGGQIVKKVEYSEEDVANFVQKSVLWELVKHIEEEHDHDDYGETTSSETKIFAIDPEIMLLQDSDVIGCVIENKALMFDKLGEEVSLKPYSYNVSRIHSVYATGYYKLRKAEGYGTEWKWDELTSTITVLHTFNSVPSVYSDRATKLILEKDTDIENVKAINLLKKIIHVEIRCEISKIMSGMFSGCEFLESIDLPSTVQTVEEYAFSGCKELRKISLPNVTEIKEYAFYHSGLKKIEGCENLTAIGTYAFNGCSNLEQFYISAKIEEIHEFTFAGCESLQAFIVSKENNNYCSELGVLYNKSKTDLIVFPNASKIKEYTLPFSVCALRQQAFRNCSNITKIYLHEGIKTIPPYCFECCTSLELVELSKSITMISTSAFKKCVSLKFVELSDSITQIETSAFSECESLKEISIPAVVELGWGVFYGCKNLEKVEFSSKLLSIPYNAFKFCFSLKNIKFPESLTEIHEHAFEDCASLETIDVPISVKLIDKHAFASCGMLREAIVRNSNCKLGAFSFVKCSNNFIFKYPMGATPYSYAFDKTVKFDLIDGKRIDCANGSFYEGKFDDSLTGYGIYRFKNGGYYEGDFVEGRFEGKGLRKYKSGSWYEGEFKNDKFEGKGKITYTRGETLVGEFKEGSPWNAKGVVRYANGTDLSGEWIDGKFTGSGKEYYSDGSWWKGTWKNGEKDVMDCCYPSKK